ncbi:amidase [Ciceribacter sp. L1K22]|uniref:amidase n=1 Tax=Ciceribacter sp. L1K22 TaxID=2820275 RepID=UPI001ABE37BE|nr:amidase [Ciceribacter sp. L1K22]MBO3762235.1 amidase [Ciceribacter sp. L1K22]
MSENLGKSVAQLAVLLQQRALDPVDLAEETLDAMANHPDKAIFTTMTADRARTEARLSSERIRGGRSHGLLDGVPIAWKDLFDLKGLSTTAGSVVLKSEQPASTDADVVTALKSAGMVCIGRTNMSEFAFSGLGINPNYGTPRNPRSTDVPRLPGGSSSGSAVAVAAGLVPVAMGTDTGGSVRIPAAFNGLVGYKASRSRYSMSGVYPLATSLDSLGPLVRTVSDAIWVDAAMRRMTAPSIPATSIADLKLVVPETVFFDGAEPGVVAAFEAAISRLEKSGVRVRRQAFPEISEIFELMTQHGALVTAEAYVLHHERLAGPDASRMDHRVVQRARLGEKISLVDYVMIQQARERLTRSFASKLSSGELIASPTLPHVAPPIEPLLENDDLFFATNGKTLRNTLIGNFLDWCGVSLPSGKGDAGMPVGFLLSGLKGQDEAVLSAAFAIEHIVGGF